MNYFWDSTATVQETNIYHCLDNFGCLWSIKCYMIWQCYSSLIGSVFSSCVLFLSQKESVSLNQHSFETCHHSDGCFWCFFHLLPGKALLVLDILAYEKKEILFYLFFMVFHVQIGSTDTCKNVNKISVPKETTGSVVNLVPICIRKAHWQPFTLNLLKDRPPANPK